MTILPTLADLRVIDLAKGPARQVGKLLAGLGAEVVFPDPGTDQDAADELLFDRGKFTFEPTGSSRDILDLATEADLLIASRDLFADGASAQHFAGQYPHLVIVVISEFGLDNTLSDWKGGEAIYQALGGQLSRSGIPGRAPLLAPGSIATQSALTQATFLTLLACFEKLQSGLGQVIDFAMLEGAAQALDPGFGIQGSATSGIAASKLPRGRPEARFQYPIIECRDGYARICVLSPRQWQGMFKWLGSPEEFSDPSFGSLITRYRSTTLIPAIAKLSADRRQREPALARPDPEPCRPQRACAAPFPIVRWKIRKSGRACRACALPRRRQSPPRHRRTDRSG